jgi:hypothetical protein
LKTNLQIKNPVWPYLLISTIVLLWAAIYNQFPIVYSDTCTYLYSGFKLETPSDRPMTYGLFMLLTSFDGITLWSVVFFQSFILAYIIYLLFKHFTACKNPQVYSLLAVIILSLTSGLPWISGMLLPDIFTPITILTLLLLVFAKDLNKKEKIIVYIIFFLSNAMHISHLMINAMLIMSILIISKIRYFKEAFIFVSKKQLYILLLLSLSGIMTMSSAISKSKHIFYMGHMLENGILKKYLDENCATHNYKLCAYKDNLPPNADRFLWDFDNSPVYKMGGWKACKDEYNTIISETFTKPEYIKLHIGASLNGTAKQLSKFNIGEGNIGFGKGTQLYECIEKNIPKNINAYAESKQTKNELTLFSSFDLPYMISIYSSLIIFLLILFVKSIRKKVTQQQILLIVFTLFGILYNDFVCATLSTVANRFACRIMWMLPLVLIVLVCDNLVVDKKSES